VRTYQQGINVGSKIINVAARVHTRFADNDRPSRSKGSKCASTCLVNVECAQIPVVDTDNSRAQ
jgi:hypothetical protein